MTFTNVAKGHALRTDAALSYLRAIRDGMPTGITSAWRPAQEQQDLYDLWKSGKGNFALTPDKSNHVKGIALDLPPAARTWMRTHGHKYGWTGVRNEPWHFDYDPTLDQFAQEADMTPEESATLKAIDARTSTMNARQVIMLNEQRAQSGQAPLDAKQLAAQITAALGDTLSDAIADELTSRGIGDPHTIAVAVTSRLANKLK